MKKLQKQRYYQNKNFNFKHNQLRKIVLSAIGIGLVVGGSIVFPNLPIILGSIIKIINEFKEVKNKSIPEKKIKRVLKNLEKKEIIELKEINNKIYVQVKDKNNISILKYSLKQLLDFKKKKKKWNKKWFMVFFDVPEIQRNKRNYLRRFLHYLGFYCYQQSVYIFPYECEKEIILIKKIIEGGKYMSYIVTGKIENEGRLKTYFRL